MIGIKDKKINKEIRNFIKENAEKMTGGELVVELSFFIKKRITQGPEDLKALDIARFAHLDYLESLY